MNKHERLILMEELIKQKGFVSMDELCVTFAVSINTVRADTRQIINKGLAKKTYGGVTYIDIERVSAVDYANYESRRNLDLGVKTAIAKSAASFVQDEDIIFIDVGTTCLPILDFVPINYNLTVVTNDLSIINKAAARKNTKILTFGGRYLEKSNSFQCTSSALRLYIESCNISKAFFGTAGISFTGSITNSENFGRELRSSLIHACPYKYLLADSSKFGKVALLTYGNISDMTACITDSNISTFYKNLFDEKSLRLITAKEDE